MKINKIELIEAELERIRMEHGGVLNPPSVVEVAADPENILHGCFQWDDTKAAQEYRLWQARQLISTIVTILPNTREPVRMYVSLKDDREEGGYRGIVDVLNDADMRRRMLKEALAEFTHFKRKYQQVKELTPVFEAAEKVEAAELEIQVA